MLIIDAHVHIWQLNQPNMDWLTGDAELHRLHRDVAVTELAAELRSNGVAGAVLVQAATDPRETAHLLQVAASEPAVLGVVGWSTMTSATQTRLTLDSWPATDWLLGIRHLHSWEPDGSVLADNRALESAGVLAERGLVLDVHMSSPIVAPAVARIAREFPSLRIVVNHLAHPDLLGPSRSRGWRDAIDTLAEHPRIAVKCSGWATRLPFPDPQVVQPYVQHVVSAFGSERIMFASNWPVASASGTTYTRTLDATVQALDLPESDLRQVMSATAVDVYGLRVRKT